MEKYKTGLLYNISVNAKRPLKGWFILQGNDGTEYIIRKNISVWDLGCYPLYRTKKSLMDMRIKVEPNQSGLHSYIALGIPVSAIIRALTSEEIWIKDISASAHVGEISTNIFLTMMITILILMGIMFNRKIVFKSFLEQNGNELEYLGHVKIVDIELKGISNRLILEKQIIRWGRFLILLLFIILPIFLLIFVKMRLFIIFFVGWYYLYIRGDNSYDESRVGYKLMI